MAVQGCIPLFDLYQKAISWFFTNTFGYNTEEVEPEYLRIKQELINKKKATKTRNGEKCLDRNLLLLEFVTKSFRTDSTCLDSSLTSVILLLNDLIADVAATAIEHLTCLFAGTCDGDNLLQLIMDILRPSLQPAISAGIGIIRFIPKLTRCRNDISPYLRMVDAIRENIKKCV
ncbi:hypothetical protein HHI36_011842 [Cryptolaemus montrouzieri]|uniref:Uncharacterized protein n=1 Tax=Cryptolaemus montrouzieri TaxID=559131 RepID=A0ABD2NE41_9CUCU